MYQNFCNLPTGGLSFMPSLSLVLPSTYMTVISIVLLASLMWNTPETPSYHPLLSPAQPGANLPSSADAGMGSGACPCASVASS